jgi:hypothetical protein
MISQRHTELVAAIGSLTSRTVSWPAWWRLTFSARRFVYASVTLGVAILFAAGFLWRWQAGELATATLGVATAHEETARAQQRAAAAAAGPVASVHLSWWEQLPAGNGDTTRSTVEQLSTDALALAPKLGIEVLRVTLAPQPQVSGAPYRSIAMQVELRGPYAEVKRWLGELLARRPQSLVLKSIDLRRTAEGAAQPGVDASVELRLYERAMSPTR